MKCGISLYPFLHHRCQHSFFTFSPSSGAGWLHTRCGGSMSAHLFPVVFRLLGGLSLRILAEVVAMLLPCSMALEVSILVVLTCVGTSELQTQSRMSHDGWCLSPDTAWILVVRSCTLVWNQPRNYMNLETNFIGVEVWGSLLSGPILFFVRYFLQIWWCLLFPFR